MYYSKMGFDGKGKQTKNPFFEINDFGHFIHDVLGGTITDAIKKEMVNTRPPLNVIESGEGYRLELPVPGMSKADIKIQLVKNTLEISANKQVDLAEGEKFARKEFDFRNFKRSFEIPEVIDTADIKAQVKEGLLVIILGKKEKQTARNINID